MTEKNKPAPAAPVTDAEIEAAITELVGANRIEAAMAERQHKAAFPPGFVASKREALRALIARRLQQAAAAAEDLARAADSIARTDVQWGEDDDPEAMFDVPRQMMLDLRTALAAFRKAQGGGK